MPDPSYKYGEMEKKEIGFGVNVFNKPLEYSGKEAWIQLILNVIFYEPGTFPTSPQLGCAFKLDEYQDWDNIKSSIINKIDSQIKTYLPDIPYESIDIKQIETNGTKSTTIFTILFRVGMDIEPVVVAARKVDNIINFEISM